MGENKLKKGVEYTGTVTGYDFPNKGIVYIDGEKVRVKEALEGQKIRFTIGKLRNGRTEGNLKEVIERSPFESEEPACSHFGQCGGCTYQTIPYKKQLEIKAGLVRKLLDQAIDYEYEFLGIEGSPNAWEYRNKMEFSFGDECRGGELTLGLHKKGSFYDILQVKDCKITNPDFNDIIKCVVETCREYGASYNHKITHHGYLRHLLIRRAATTGEILINLITTTEWKDGIITETEFLGILKTRLKELDLGGSIVGILHSYNDDPADAVKAEKTDILYGKEFFFEEILGLYFKITTFSFFQTNSFGAEVLYGTVRDFVNEPVNAGHGNPDLSGKRVIYDLYTGTGTIAQVLSPVAKKVIGVEIVPEAVNAAKENAALNELDNCEFICGDVLKSLDEIEEKPDIIILDPPREGIHPKALTKIINYGVDRIIYISCKPTSLVNDLKALHEGGYRVEKVKCVDMFPQTVHIETVALLSKLSEAKHHIEVKVDMDELDLTSAETKATYKEIQDWVQEKYGFHVTNLNIAQVKQKHGIIERENYNKPKSENSKQPGCPEEKIKAIEDAMQHFQMI
ncbi:MAG: 23S rRNA (uracil(1939)-C(5))-methyltransferase RlmD [Lachnospiraceae bacterium]|nr:23S rRNA (uracil(1939)-C(5))-methyltransferase RlmD [Lachnospiraceae bacterium]